MKAATTCIQLAACALLIGLSACSSPMAETAEYPVSDQPTAGATADSGKSVMLEFKSEIAAPVVKVWDTMFAPDTYTKWTSAFMPGSYFEGSWSEGSRIHFLAPGGDGMVSEIAVNRPREYLSIKHLGYVQDGVEDTTSDAVRSWAPSYENYRFKTIPGGTLVTVEQEVPTEYADSMTETWPAALAMLKSLCEAD
ncbi:MAG: SRPBCC domain-containing protein [Planctomycetota bacterium]